MFVQSCRFSQGQLVYAYVDIFLDSANCEPSDMVLVGEEKRVVVVGL